ncbi:SseB family protein [Rudaeicoccus suwonensis]|uniref:Type III secretion system (T3SS) SseB-like protein n=1 Tax=Rudaeicoccus suwonensis TaxID=657409 RepID=A0A561EA11_9MICO|nr:SseB family protein [Rudaeicoccus suwonensis]TWE12449.1 type III secretion system (T3SS) SseB-like protein [Rudaeicoccus suwonensis]
MSTDSAGQPFNGRSLTSTGFDGDDGAADPALVAALDDRSDEPALMRVIATARLLVPIVAAATDVDDTSGVAVEKSTDMAVVTLTSPTGERALPVFTSVAALAQWNPEARPSPVQADRAAQAAISERCDVMVLDAAGDRPLVLRPSMVWALAQRSQWQPAHVDPHVQQAISAAVHDEPAVARVSCEAGGTPGELRVVLAVVEGLTQPELQSVAQRIGERIATDGETRARIDGLSFAITVA